MIDELVSITQFRKESCLDELLSICTMHQLLNKAAIKPCYRDRKTNLYFREDFVYVLLKAGERKFHKRQDVIMWRKITSRIKNEPEPEEELREDVYTAEEIGDRTRSILNPTFITDCAEREGIKPVRKDPNEYRVDNLVRSLVEEYKDKTKSERRMMFISLYCLDRAYREGSAAKNLRKSLKLGKREKNLLLTMARAVYGKVDEGSVTKRTAVYYLLQDFKLPYDTKRKIFDLMKKEVASIDAIEDGERYKPSKIVKVTTQPWFEATVKNYLERIQPRNEKKLEVNPNDTWARLGRDKFL